MPAFPPEQFPVIAAGLLPADARVLAPDKYGGYLIYRFDGKLKVFFDGRSDFYGSGFMKSYIRLIEVRPGWREQLNAVEVYARFAARRLRPGTRAARTRLDRVVPGRYRGAAATREGLIWTVENC